MQLFLTRILVEDASGARFVIFELGICLLGIIRLASRFELETGEVAEALDQHTFRLVGSGETLVRVECHQLLAVGQNGNR